jgi:putative addiction module component (TIGR02574 family)
MSATFDLLAEAMKLPADEREELAARLLDSLEPSSAISIEDEEELRRRADEARSGAAGIPWDQVKRGLGT